MTCLGSVRMKCNLEAWALGVINNYLQVCGGLRENDWGGYPGRVQSKEVRYSTYSCAPSLCLKKKKKCLLHLLNHKASPN